MAEEKGGLSPARLVLVWLGDLSELRICALSVAVEYLWTLIPFSEASTRAAGVDQASFPTLGNPGTDGRQCYAEFRLHAVQEGLVNRGHRSSFIVSPVCRSLRSLFVTIMRHDSDVILRDI
jgi:hypothetical protein